VTRDTVVLADRARRSGGRRRFNPRDYRPAFCLQIVPKYVERLMTHK
jgi:hypothetical protein